MDRYRIIRPLGSGGMGRVYLAEDREKMRDVALKFLPSDCDLSAYERFRDEVSLLSHLSHPNLIRIFDYFEEWDAEDSWTKKDALTGPLFSMEHVDGPTLDRAAKKLGPEPTIDLFVGLCRGLHYLHARGILHRDLKPANILVTSAGPKLLDFGLAGVLHPAEKETFLGTFEYMAPEAQAGVYDARSDLFSLGAVFKEISRGRTDLPPYFTDLLDRLLQTESSKRPASALTLIKFLNRHAERPYEIEELAVSERVLQKIPWVPREEEGPFRKTLAAFQKSGIPSLLVLTGPAGAGRTRLLEETKWHLRLEGVSYRENEMTEGDIPLVISFQDLHEWPEHRIEELELYLRRALRRGLPIVAILEYDRDLMTTALQKLISYAETWPSHVTFQLSDLAPETARAFLRQATLDFPISRDREDEIVAGAGGRPLLLLEALRAQGVPASIEESCRIRVQNLEAGARELLAVVVAHPEGVSSSEALAVYGELKEFQIALQQQDFLKSLALSHPSLREAYRKALPAELLTDVHKRWLAFLSGRGEVRPVVGPQAVVMTEHALGANDAAAALAWGVPTMEYRVQEGAFAQALDLSEKLLERTDAPNQQALLFAHQAPLFYRMGRYEDALKAYDRWFELKADDGTGVEKTKHLLYTGLVFYTWGRAAEARKRLETCLKTGDGTRHQHHRPYLARAQILLAALCEKEKKTDEAERHLEGALSLAEGVPLLLGEIENQRGALLQTLQRPDDAILHFQKSARHYRESQSPQAEAIAHNAVGTSERHRGNLFKALESANESIALAERGGEILQQARHRANRALILMDLARYGEGLEDLDASEDVLEQYGTDDDRKLAREHRGLLNLALGHEGPVGDLASSFVWERFEGWRKAKESPIASKAGLLDVLESILRIESPEARRDAYRLLALSCENQGLAHLSERLQTMVQNELKKIHQALPEELKMDFEKNRDLQEIDRALGESSQRAVPSPVAVSAPDAIPRARFRQFCEINRKIASGQKVEDVLERVLDAAIDVTGAERGALLLKKEGKEGSELADYDVKSSRHVSRKALEGDALKVSFTAVLEAVKKGEPVLTDDAQLDPRFRKKQSVVAFGLKSILVLPLDHEGETIGAVYLDHRYQPGCFSEESILFLTALAAQASLAIQKARLIGDLAAAKESLETRVDEQAHHIEHLSGELTRTREQFRYGYEEMIGRSKRILKVFDLLDHVSETTIPVWILGESGTGKELVARSLHANSPRKEGPFVAENVSAIPETLLESELFGHKKGSFTHADRDRVGLFEQASGGTLFLDEVADMSLAMQAKLLRVLQEGEVRPVGSSKKLKINVRLVTASNRDLKQLVKAGKFREDLFFRINGLTIKLPPLRERKEDIPLLADHFLKRISKEFGLPAAELAEDGLQALTQHDWPGNIRELEATLRNALLFAKGKPVDRKLLMAQENLARSPASSSPSASLPPGEGGSESVPEEKEERAMILDALRRAKTDKKAAAKDLGISLRTLYSRMDWHRIPKKKGVLAKHVGLK